MLRLAHLLFNKEGKLVEVFQSDSGTTGYGSQGVFSYVYWKLGFTMEPFVEAA